MIIDLDLLRFQSSLRMRKEAGQPYIWDIVRMQWIRFTPEEMVRQLVLNHLVEMGFSLRMIQVEKKVLYHGLF